MLSLISETYIYSNFAAFAVNLPPLEILIVFGIILAALFLFVTEVIPVDVTAIGLIVILIILQPWTGVSASDGVSGFANSATITVLALFMLSEGVRKTGAVDLLSKSVLKLTGDSKRRALAATILMAGPPGGFVNNTPVVAILIPTVRTLAKAASISPSKLLIPLSFASMLGGSLTLIGTSGNLLASELSNELIGRPFSMFEFFKLGVLVLITGSVYLFTLGWVLTPARIKSESGLADEFDMAEYLTDVVVGENSKLVGMTVRSAMSAEDIDMEIFQIIRNGKNYTRSLDYEVIQPNDILAVAADKESLVKIIEEKDLSLLGEIEEENNSGQDGEKPDKPVQNDTEFAEIVVLPGSTFSGRRLSTWYFRSRFDLTVLAVRRGENIIKKRMKDVMLKPGDTLLVRGSRESIERINSERNFIVANKPLGGVFNKTKIPVSIAIMAGVIGLAAFDVLPIMVSALAGVFAMIITGCITSADAYEAVNWDIIFLLAGVIPLGIAMERSGAADLLASYIVGSTQIMSPVFILALVYLLTAILTNLVSNNASIVLMVPISVEVAGTIGANQFSFVLAVTFAAITALLTPVGYQTNLMVYGPGGYRFGDFFRVGAPLQLILMVVTTLGIIRFWGI